MMYSGIFNQMTYLDISRGMHYDETHLPVVRWLTIRFVIVLALLHGWATRQLDFVLAYPQADIEADVFMELPQGF